MYPGALKQRLGMLSDDTEHACMTAQALLEARGCVATFERVLAWKLRWWLLALPPAIGGGTLRALVRLWFVGPKKSGVMSAGNGAVMRAPIIGAWLDDPDRIPAFVAASTRITHRDPRAMTGALAIAIAAHHAARDDELAPERVMAEIRRRIAEDDELSRALERVAQALRDGTAPIELAEQLGLKNGVTGYVHHTVPMCLQVWLRSPRDVRRAIEEVVQLGGDSDTTAAIVGALAGAAAGAAGIPEDWLGIVDYPRSLSWIRQLGARLEARGEPLALCWPAVPARNVVFLVIALAIGLRRLLPPY